MMSTDTILYTLQGVQLRPQCGRNYSIHYSILFVQEPLAQMPYRKESAHER